MFRLLFLLLGKNIEVCKGCEVLKQQLDIANNEKHELTETLLSLIKPKVIEAPPREVAPIQPALAGTWGRKRAALEEAERQKARIAKDSPFIGKANIVTEKPEKLIEHVALDESIEKLEAELGVSEKEEVKEHPNASNS